MLPVRILTNELAELESNRLPQEYIQIKIEKKSSNFLETAAAQLAVNHPDNCDVTRETRLEIALGTYFERIIPPCIR